MRDPSVLGVIDWTPVIVAIITLIGVMFTAVCQVFFYYYIKPPSGHRRLGRMMEETHANSAASLAAVTGLEEDTNGKTTHPPVYQRQGDPGDEDGH